MTDDPVARLKAGLDADEAAASAAQDWNPGPWTWTAVGARDYLQEMRDARGSFVAEFAGGADVRPYSVIHAAHQDPARTLREVAAKRKILALAKINREKMEDLERKNPPPGDPDAIAAMTATAVIGLVLTALADVYADDAT